MSDTPKVPELKAALVPVEVKKIIYICPTCTRQIPAQSTLMTDPPQYVHECCGNRWTTPYRTGQIVYQDIQEEGADNG